ncbi:Hypothetical_protein [Hexamita inflata]|uniref:Hypothetical_protein n=1 Tax=Hexamita inflata TaxID=28002 RepID=A0AA86U173_9EUKA|nr:Hypothetical protein HINF_LOCUS22217 [Hexamita inflata]
MERELITFEQQLVLEGGFVTMVNEHCNAHFSEFANALNHFKGLPYASTCKFNWKRLDQMVWFGDNETKSKSLQYIKKCVLQMIAVKQEVPIKVQAKLEPAIPLPAVRIPLTRREPVKNNLPQTRFIAFEKLALPVNIPVINIPVRQQTVIPAFTAKTESEERHLFSAYVKELSFCDSSMLCPLQEYFE